MSRAVVVFAVVTAQTLYIFQRSQLNQPLWAPALFFVLTSKISAEDWQG